MLLQQKLYTPISCIFVLTNIIHRSRARPKSVLFVGFLGPPQPQRALPSVVTVFTVYTALCCPGTSFTLTVQTLMFSALACILHQQAGKGLLSTFLVPMTSG